MTDTVVTENRFGRVGFSAQFAVFSEKAVLSKVKSLAVPATRKPELARLTETVTGEPASALPVPPLS